MTPELLFGSMSQGWPALTAASRPLTPIPPAGVGMPTPTLGNGGVPGPMTGFDASGGLTVPALLAAVAARRGQPLGPTNDQEIEDFVGDALDLLPGSNDIEIRCDGGRVTLTGQVSQKRLKRDAGEIAWVTPGVNDVQNNITIVARRRPRSSRESETPAAAGRKQP